MPRMFVKYCFVLVTEMRRERKLDRPDDVVRDLIADTNFSATVDLHSAGHGAANLYLSEDRGWNEAGVVDVHGPAVGEGGNFSPSISLTFRPHKAFSFVLGLLRIDGILAITLARLSIVEYASVLVRDRFVLTLLI